jgi:hypothetical protein
MHREPAFKVLQGRQRAATISIAYEMMPFAGLRYTSLT